MRRRTPGWHRIVLPAVAAIVPLGAGATAYEWTGGAFSRSGVPNPLGGADSVLMHSPSEAAAFDVDFVSRSNFAWRDDNLVFFSGVTVTNAREGVWTSLDDHGLLRTNAVATVPKFVNEGVFKKTGGGPTNIVNVDFINSGTILAENGVIALNSPTKTFRAGTDFQGVGAGRIEVRNGGVFEGGFKARNFELVHGTHHGREATLTEGQVDWTAGAFTGTWFNEATFLVRDTGGSRHFGDKVVFTNGTTWRWQSGDITFGNDAQFVNRGTYRVLASVGTAATAFNWISGAFRPTFTNHGTFLDDRSEGDPASTLFVGDVHFVNHGTVRAPVRGHDIRFNGPSTFEDGSRLEGNGRIRIASDATFRGRIVSSNAALVLSSGRFTGADAQLQGLAVWHGGTLAGSWRNESHLIVGERPDAPLRIEGVLVNTGRISYPGLSELVIGFGRVGTTTVFDNRGTLTFHASFGQVQLQREGLATDTKIENRGTFIHTGRGETTVALPFDNLGKVEVFDGTLRFGGALVQEGEIVGDAKATLVVPGGTVNRGLIRGFELARIEGHLINEGRIEPGQSPGSLRIEGDLVHGAGGVLDLELHDASSFDRLAVAGSVQLLGGTLALRCFAGCPLAAGDQLGLIDAAGGLDGRFADVTLHGFGPGWRFDLDYDGGQVVLDVLQVGAVPEPATILFLALGLAGLSAVAPQTRGACRRPRKRQLAMLDDH